MASGEPIDAACLLATIRDQGFPSNLGHLPGEGVVRMIDAAEADTLVELSITDLETGEPATTHVRHALSAGWNVVTTNKGPIALHYGELRELASRNGVTLAFEGTVMSGTPVIQLAGLIRSAGCKRLVGILNGTTNYIITEVERGATYEEALTRAQHHGYAEADPSGDVDGSDSAAKLVILGEIIADASIALGEVDRVPLSSVSADEVHGASTTGEKIRYVASLEDHAGSWRASVSPRRLPGAHPLAGVSGAGNGVTFGTELLGEVTILGPGAGPRQTAFAVLSDLRRIDRDQLA